MANHLILKKLNQKVEPLATKSLTLLMNGIGLVLDHAYFASAVNLSRSADELRGSSTLTQLPEGFSGLIN